MKQTLLFSIAISLAFLLSNCSKEKKIENRLTKADGTWNVKSISYTLVKQSSSGQTIVSGTASDAGTFTFEDSGKGSFSYTVENELREGEFSWSVSGEDVTLAYTNQTVDMNSFGFNQTIIAYAGLMSSKTELSLDGTETNQYASGDYSQKVFTGNFSLEKN